MVKAARSPAARKPAAKPATPATTAKPAADKPAVPKPAVAKPTVAKSAAAKPAATKPATLKAAATKRGPAAKASPRGTGKAARSSARAAASAKAAAAAPKPPARKTADPAGGTSAQPAPINLGFLSGFVGFHLRLAQDASYRAFARIKDKELVKPGRFPALAIIHLNPGISQSALGRAIARDKSTVSPLIKDLQKNGLINRKPSPNDRRSVTLALTKKGERVLDRLHARALEHEEDLDKVIGASKARLVGMLDKITGGLAVA